MSFIVENGTIFLYYLLGIIIITNPLSTALIFITLSKDADEKEKKETAIGAASISTAILTLFALGGLLIFKFFGISIGAFQITGGIVLISVGMKLLRGEGKDVHESHFVASEVMVVPLAIPMLSGAGAITTVIVFASEGGSAFQTALLVLAVACNGILAYLILQYSEFVEKMVKERTQRVINKIMGLIVLSMAVEFIIHGISRTGIF